MTTPPVATGRVSRFDSSRAANARVVLMAWPPDEVMESLQVGDSVRMVPIARATADENGNFELRISETVDYRSVSTTPTDQIADLDIVVDTVEGTTSFSFSRDFSDPTAPAVDVDMQLSRAPRPTQEEATAESEPIERNMQCTTSFVQDYGATVVLVGQIFNETNSGAYETYKYTAGAQSSLGIGASGSGNYGSWSQSGTTTKSSTATQTFPKAGSPTRRLLDTFWRYGKYKQHCWLYWNSWDTYYAKPVSYAGGSQIRWITSTPVSATKCIPQANGSAFELYSTTNVTWTDGVNTGAFLGIGLSTKTGYSTTAGFLYEFTANRHLCGWKDFPGNAPVIVVAKN